MKNARTVRTLARTGLDLGFTYLPSGKGVRRIAKLIRAQDRLWNQLRPNEQVGWQHRNRTIRQMVKDMTSYINSEFREVAH